MKPAHIFLLLLAAAIWGLNFVVTRIALEVFSTEQLSFSRAWMTLILLLPWWKPWIRVSVRFLGAALLIGTVSFYCLYEAIRVTDSLTTVAIGTQLMPPIAAIVGLVLYHEQVSNRKWLGILVATAGAMFLAGAAGFGISAAALGLTIISVFFYATGSIIVSRTASISVWRMLAWIAAIGIIPMGLVAAAAGPIFPNPEIIHLRHWLALAYAILLSALVGQAVLFSMYGKYPVANVAPFMLLIPVFAGLFSIVVYKENPTMGLIVGGGIVLLGVWIQQSRSNSKKPPGQVS
jgi:O-acetylserine/cysteine efflux transporter